MMGPIAKRDIERAQQILKGYTEDLEGLTDEECQGAAFTHQQCDVLNHALQTGKGGEITSEERNQLEEAQFSKAFIETLAGKDGREALRNRVHYWERSIRLQMRFVGPGVSLDTQKELVKEMREIALMEPNLAVRTLLTLTKMSEDTELYKEIGRVFRQMGSAAVPPLIWILKYENRWTATIALVRVGAPAVPALIEALKDKDIRVQYSAIFALGQIGLDAAPAVPHLMEIFEKNRNKYFKQSAAQALVKIGPASTSVVPLLTERLRGDIDLLGHLSLHVLGNLGPDVVPLLIELLGNERADVREDVADAFVVYPLGSAAIPAIPILRKMAQRDPNISCRRRAQKALDKLSETIQ